MPPYVTQAEYARHRQVSRQAVFKAVKSGRIQLTDNKIDLAIADVQWSAMSDPGSRGGPGTGVAGSSILSPTTQTGQPPPPGASGAGANYAAARAVTETYRAKLAKFNYEKELGKFVTADEVRIEAFTCARDARNQMLTIADKVASSLSAMTDVQEIRTFLRQHILIACRGLGGNNPDD